MELGDETFRDVGGVGDAGHRGVVAGWWCVGAEEVTGYAHFKG
jgi:hypothetical protein